MTEARLPQELEEQAALFALGLLEPDDRRAFAVRLQGESLPLRQATTAYRAVAEALASGVAPVAPGPTLRERLVSRIAHEAARETAQFESVANTLALSAAPVAPRASLRERVLAHIGKLGDPQLQMESAFTFLRTSELEWQEISPGTFVKVLHNDTANARATVLCRMEPGSMYGSHRHAQMEELFVLEGTCHCAGRLMHAGDYHRAEAGSVHPPTSTETGSLMLVISSTQNQPLS
ncbi:MAG: cupin domain-containing protein [Nitrospira sp.]|nr:cupin domain-containing protein [Nitrospira sp.]